MVQRRILPRPRHRRPPRPRPRRRRRYAERAWAAGVDHVEVTIETPDALASLKAVAHEAASWGKYVGAGTVTTLEQLEAARRVGVSFTVSPGLDPDIVKQSARSGIPHLPGVSTPSEILQARRLGLSWLKAFPAAVLGPSWLAAMSGPFPDVSFVATGGMSLQNAGAALDAGAKAIGLGSPFASPDAVRLVGDFIRSRRESAFV
jgi:Entner-Doudoroff aldolase